MLRKVGVRATHLQLLDALEEPRTKFRPKLVRSYDEGEVDTTSFGIPSSVLPMLSYKVAIVKPLSVTAEDCKSTPIQGAYDSLSNIEIDGKPATMILANQFTTVEYVKDDKALITLQFKEAEGTDGSNAINAALKSFKATRIQ